MNDLEKFEQEQVKKHSAQKKIPEFGPGDTVRVNVRIVEGAGDDAKKGAKIAKGAKGAAEEMKTRIQAYEGVCIARGGKGINQSFTVRKISYGEGVERVFPLFSPNIDSIELVRRGSVRRAKLYYLRKRSGKSARITEREYDGGADVIEAPTEKSSAPAVAPEKKAAAG